jgi:hypothetical protein
VSTPPRTTPTRLGLAALRQGIAHPEGRMYARVGTLRALDRRGWADQVVIPPSCALSSYGRGHITAAGRQLVAELDGTAAEQLTTLEYLAVQHGGRRA